MKTKTLLAMGLCAAIGFVDVSALAGNPALGTPGEEHSTSLPSTLEGIRAMMLDQHRELHNAVALNKISEAHTHVAIIRRLSEASLDRMVAEDRSYVYPTVANVIGTSDELEKALTAANPAALQNAHGRLEAVLQTLESQLAQARPIGQSLRYQSAYRPRYVAPRRSYARPHVVRPRVVHSPRVIIRPVAPRPPVQHKPPPQKHRTAIHRFISAMNSSTSTLNKYKYET